MWIVAIIAVSALLIVLLLYALKSRLDGRKK